MAWTDAQKAAFWSHPDRGEDGSWYGPTLILNTSIITAHGVYHYRPATLEDAKELARKYKLLSAVGHESTAQILTDLLGKEVPVNRIAAEQQIGQPAIVFKLRGRLPEGKILTREEVEAIGYEFGYLERRE